MEPGPVPIRGLELGPDGVYIPGHLVEIFDAKAKELTEQKWLEDNDGILHLTLLRAARDGGLPCVEFLLRNDANGNAMHYIDLQRQGDRLPLIEAARHGHLEIVRLLLDREVNIHARGDTPLIVAAQGGHLEVVRLLLDHGANIHASGPHETFLQRDKPLIMAARENRVEVVRLLLNRGARGYNTALLDAQLRGHNKVAALLRERIP